MPFNGSGTFTRSYSWASDATNGILVRSDRMDGEDNNFASGLSNVICKDGQTTTTAQIPFASGIKTNDGTVSTPAVTFTSEPSTGLYKISAGVFGITTSGVNTVSISSANMTTGSHYTYAGATPLFAAGTAASYYQVSFQNKSSGTTASTDVVCTADTGTDTTNYVNMGINSSGYSGTLFNNALDGYLYSQSSNLAVGTVGANDLVVVTNNAENARFTSSGNFNINTNKFTVAGATGNTNIGGTLAVVSTLSAAGITDSVGTVTASINGGQFSGLRNRTINGDMRIDQRNSGSSQTITAAAAAAYTVDRFYATCTGANVTGQRVAGTSPNQYKYQFTGAASVSAIAFGQRYESANVYDLVSSTATFSVNLANSLLTTVTWTAYYPTATDNWASRTQIATGTFTISSTPTVYSAQIALGANITAGLEIELSVGAQTSGTWSITNWQLENGTIATPFERRSLALEMPMCVWYYESGGPFAMTGNGSSLSNFFIPYAEKRIIPTIVTANLPATSGTATAKNGYSGWLSAGAASVSNVTFTASAEL